ncbi:hypothetical protein NIES4102_00630 [Chondrocystis sp. NIES-4102]|nr:hypothetical protein NIES4102_00630 [Chondrocystis sp. NIES-4102]
MTIFERATIFSSVFVFILFGIVGLKYYHSLEGKKQASTTSIKAELQQK